MSREYFNLSIPQKSILAMENYYPKDVFNNITGILIFKNNVSKDAIEKAFNKTVYNNEAFRLRIVEKGGQYYQYIGEFEAKSLEYKNFEGMEEEYNHWLNEEKNQYLFKYDGDLYAAKVVRTPEGYNSIVLTTHHLIQDAYSLISIFGNKLLDYVYDLDQSENGVNYSYKKYVYDEADYLKSNRFSKDSEFWKSKLIEYDGVSLYKNNFSNDIKTETIVYDLGEDFTEKMDKFCSENKISIFNLFLGAVAYYKSALTNNQSVVIGTPLLNRINNYEKNTMGMFINTLPLFLNINSEENVKTLLHKVKSSAFNVLRHGKYPYQNIRETYVKLKNDTQNLFEVILSYQNTKVREEIDRNSYEVQWVESDRNLNPLIISILDHNNTGSFRVKYDFQLNKISKDDIKLIHERIVNIVTQFISDSNSKIGDVEVTAEGERNKLLEEFNNTKVEYPRDKTIDQLFEEQVERTPNNAAVVFEDKCLTYKELNEKANSLARNLRKKGVGPDTIAAVMVERSLDMIVGIMAVLKAGGAYLPIDPKYPEDRIGYMLENSQTKIILTQDKFKKNITYEIDVCSLDSQELYSCSSGNLERTIKPSNLAYIIYTSGTTGKPKGVMIEHRNVVRLLFNDNMPFEFNNEDVWTMFHSYCFDFSVWEMYGALLYGGKLIIVPELTAKDSEKFLFLLNNQKVTVLNQTPSAFYSLMNSEADSGHKDLCLRYIIFGGEALNVKRLHEWKKKYSRTKLVNMYGITETTVHVTYKEIGIEDIEKGINSVGRPIPTLSTYVMNENLKLQPIGVPGELCVGGAGTARGYLNNPELTKEKFVINPYKPDEIIYKSGDLVRLMEDGCMEYLGRIDQQVKIRGFRIELGEIENSLLKIEGIKEAIVTEGEEGENKYLCAYYVGKKEYSAGELREKLKKSLPDYMMPSYFIKLDSMPLTANGKVDKKNLPQPEGKINTGVQYEAPRNELEEKLVRIWEEVLGVSDIGINDNFFELGGHSLSATALAGTIHRELDIEVPLIEIFNRGSIKELSRYMFYANKKEYVPIKKVEEKEYYEASSAQKRMYMLQEIDKGSTAYNMPESLEVLGDFQIDKINEIFVKLIERHEVLRTSFHVKDDNIVQKIHEIEKIKFKIEKIEVKSEEEVREKIDTFIKPFNLAVAPLFRVWVISLEKNRHIMLFDMHHIISDGISMSILTKEFSELYAGKELEELKIQYKDYAAWQLKKMKSAEFIKQEQYWLKEFSGDIPVLDLPTDYIRPQAKDFKGRSIDFILDKVIASGLKSIANRTGSTLYMVLLSIINILLSKWSGQEDIIVGSPIAGRNHIDLENVMGVFVNTLAIRSIVNRELSFKEYLETVKVKALKAYENQDYQFEELVDRVKINRDLSRNPLYDVMFALQNMEEAKIEIEGVTFKPYTLCNNMEKLDMTISAAETKEGEIHFNLSYAASLYKVETMEKMAKHFLNLVNQVVKNSEVKLKDIVMFSKEDREYFNLSIAQNSILSMESYQKKDVFNNITGILIFKNNVSKDAIEKAFNKTVYNNEAFRLRIVEKGGQYYQYISKFEAKSLEYKNFEGKEEEYKHWLNEKKNQYLFTYDGDLYDAKVVRMPEGYNSIVLTTHHLIHDAYSLISIFGNKLLDYIYDLDQSENGVNYSYKKYVYDEADYLKSNRFYKDRDFWNGKISEYEGVPLFGDSFDNDPKAETIVYDLGKDFTEKMNEFCSENKISVFNLFLGVLAYYKSVLTNSNSASVGTLILNRMNNYEKNTMGMFVKGLPIFLKVNREESVKELLQQMKKSAFEMLRHQRYPYENIRDTYIKLKQDIQNLGEITLSYQNAKVREEIDRNSYEVQWVESDRNLNPLTISILDHNNTGSFRVKYDFQLSKISKEDLKLIHERLINILTQFINNCEDKISNIQFVTEKEKDKLLVEFNNTKADYPRDKTVSELFEEQVERTPNNTAVVFEDKTLTYLKLNQRANSLARGLREKGVGPDTIVGIMVERSLEMIVGIMGVLKAGAAYLPIDPGYPEGRIKYILENSGTKIILTQGKFKEKINEENIAYEIEICDLNSQDLYSRDNSNLETAASPNNLAYVIYTSGTTGNPKGVMIENKSIINRINWMQRKYPIEQKDAILQKTTNTFDVSVWEILWWSFVGAKVRMLVPGGEGDPNIIVKNIEEGNITTIHFVPSMFSVFINYVISENKVSNIVNLKRIFTSGEALKPEQANLFYEKIGKVNNTKLINLYGPTEAAVDVTYYECGENEKVIPIGKPIDNIKMYITDKNKNLLPVGVVGELCISGDGLARGYLNNKALTKEKFVDNPYEMGQKMYKTGDLAKWMEDGNIEFLGRIDHQVKIRGFRIELGEIESSLLKIEGIKEAVVIARGEGENKYLCAYYVGEKEYSVAELRENLKKSLPDYMLPAYFVKLESIPLTHNGKMDRKALPEPEGKINTGAEYEVPRNELEEKLLQIWEEVLGVSNIGISDNFFELGGNSLKAIALLGRIHKELKVEIPLRKMFEARNIKGFSEYISSSEQKEYEVIEKVEEKKYYEASSAQKRMYLMQELDKDSTAYNMAGSIEVQGNLQIDRINIIFMKLIERHEALRTSFHLIDGSVVQKIHGIEEIKLEIERIEVKNEEEVKEKIEAFTKPFDLEMVPLIRAAVIRLEKDRHIIVFDMHHIISDGVSMSILTSEFSQLYEGKDLKELRIQYKDYAAWQIQRRESEKFKKHEKYWLNEFSGKIPVLNLPTDYRRPKVRDFKGESIRFVLDKELTGDLRKLARETGTTLYMVLLSNVNILLSKYSGQEDIVIGSPIAGRGHMDLENIIGVFVNTLAVRNTVNDELSFKDYLEEVKTKALKAYENEEYQFEELVEKVNINRDLSRNPLFDVMFTLQNTEELKMEEETEIQIGELTFKPYALNNSVEKFDMTITAAEEKEEIHFNLSYASSLYKHETMERMIEHFLNIIKCIVKNREIKLKDIEILSEKEKNKLLVEFNNTKMEYPRNKTVDQLFEEQVERTPGNIAVVYDGEELTYSKLNKKANSLAGTLREKGVGPDAVVAMIVERSLEMIIGIMGVLKAGGAYLPIDPECPEERIKYMLENSEAKILLTQSSLIRSGKVENIGSQIEIFDLNKEELYSNNDSNLEKVHTPGDLAYIIYTSGTTGKPKGIMMEHGSVSNYVATLKNDIYSMYGPALSAVLVSPYYFDASVQQIFAALTEGHVLHVVPESTRKNGEELLKYYEKNHIDTSDGTPMHLSMITNAQVNTDNLNLKCIMIGSDKLLKDQVKEAYDKFPNIRINNVYGPTECCVTSTMYLIDKESLDNLTVIPIGKPLGNTRMYIVDENYNLMPIGVPGELCISGVGLARGYLNNKVLTEEKFVDNPYEMGQKMYKTGDLAKWMEDGNIEFLGRIDHQVKIRGFRIELGEIESSLLKIEGIKEAVVIARGEEDKYLCAYYAGEKEYSTGRLREELKKSLPDYMIPVYFIKLKNMPLTANGKLDRRSLPEPEGKINTGAEYEAPRNELEEKLLQIWEQVLGVSNIGINDNFFELGGHSLKATTLLGRINKELEVKVPLREIFEAGTIKGLSEYIASANKMEYEVIEKVEEKEYYEASSAQKRMYLLQELDKDSTAYNMPVSLEILGNIETNRIGEIFTKLIERHEALRTGFQLVDGSIVQIIYKAEEIELKIEKLEVKDEEEVKEKIKTFAKPFNLEKAPLFRVSVITLEKNRHIMLLDIHHIISDGVSVAILTREFSELYEGKELQELRIQYKEYTAWQLKHRESEKFKKQEQYWLQEFSSEIPELNLLTDYIRPNAKDFKGRSIDFVLDKETTESLRKLASETGSTLYMVLLSDVNILLSKYSGQEDIVVGSPIAGRNHTDLENVIGMFVNTLAIRSTVNSELSFRDYLETVKAKSLKAYENQDYQFEELVEKINVDRDLSRNPLFDVMFVLQNMEKAKVEAKDLTFKQYVSDSNIEKFDITIAVVEGKDELYFNLSYATSLYKYETMERMVKCFSHIVKLTSSSPEIIIKNINLITEEEVDHFLSNTNNNGIDEDEIDFNF